MGFEPTAVGGRILGCIADNKGLIKADRDAQPADDTGPESE